MNILFNVDLLKLLLCTHKILLLIMVSMTNIHFIGLKAYFIYKRLDFSQITLMFRCLQKKDIYLLENNIRLLSL